MQKVKSGFTLIEVTIALSLFAFVIIGIVLAVNKAYTYVQISKLQMMSMNFARAGVEMIYTIRDTNWRKNSGNKDKYWLLADPFMDVNGSENPPGFFQPGLYKLSIKSSGSGQQYPALSSYAGSDGEEVYEKFNKYVDSIGSEFLIPFSGMVYVSGSQIPLSDLMEREAKFYRVVKVEGLYNKTNSNADTVVSNCTTLDDCTSSNPKELRFCVRVFYIEARYGYSELCSVMTNFRK